MNYITNLNLTSIINSYFLLLFSLLVNCPLGYFFNSDGCQACVEDHFQDQEAQNECVRCPSGTSTFGETGSKESKDCQGELKLFVVCFVLFSFVQISCSFFCMLFVCLFWLVGLLLLCCSVCYFFALQQSNAIFFLIEYNLSYIVKKSRFQFCHILFQQSPMVVQFLSNWSFLRFFFR